MGAGKKLWGLYPGPPEVWLPLRCNNLGQLVVDMTNVDLEDLGDVNLAGIADGDVIIWNLAAGEWQPGAVAFGGVYGIRLLVLTGNITLTPGTDVIYQYLDEGGADRIITLDTASATAGDRFVIRHNGLYNDTRYLWVMQAAISLDFIFAGAVKEFIFDGTNWISRGIGTGENDNKQFNITIGRSAMGYGSGVAVGSFSQGYNVGVGVGYGARGYSYGAGVGYGARGETSGVAIGYQADGHSSGVAVGRNALTNAKRYSIALGRYSECERVGETSVCIDASLTQKNNAVQGRWSDSIAGGAGATEIFCADYGTNRFTVRAQSALAFRITVVARDDTADEVAMYTFEGVIKRDAANNTTMAVCNKIVVHEDDAAWDCNVTADDVNEALIITVTGDDTNPTQWAARMDGVETHF